MRMRTDLSAILVVDVEATCWETKSPPDGQTSEIIQIGLCELSVEKQAILSTLDLIVKPEKSSVSEYCTKLTGLTQERVDKGITYAEASEIIRKYSSKKRTWASFGDYDRYMFEKMSKEFNVLYPFGSKHINVKNLLALKHKLPREVGMPGALDKLKLKLVGRHHNGADDAKNIAEILMRVLWG